MYRTEVFPVSDLRTCNDKIVRNRTSGNSTWCGKEDEMNEHIEAKVTEFNEKYSNADFSYTCGANVTINGDSGGPLMRRDEYGFWNLIAIVKGIEHFQTLRDPCDNSTTENFSMSVHQVIVPFLDRIYEAIGK